MKSKHYSTIVKGFLFSFMLLSMLISCSEEDLPPVIPNAAFSFSPTSPKINEEVTFTNTSSNATSFQWSAAGTNFSSTEENPKFTFTAVGQFNVKLIATNANETHEVINTITVTEALPIANFSFSPQNPETGQEVTFTDESQHAASYQWSAENTSFSATAANPKFTFDTAGDFVVKMIVTNTAGSHEISKTVTVTEAQVAPVANFSFAPTAPKTGEEVTFTNESENATEYQWSAEGTNFSATDANPKFTFAIAGDYAVKLIVTNAVGTDEIVKTVTVSEAQSAPVADFSFAPTSPETGEEVTFTNESQDATSYQWSAAGTNFSSTEANPKFTFATAGDFDVKLVVTNAVGTDEITKTVTVTQAVAAPVADFSFAPTNPETGQEVSFTNESQNATSYQWSAAGTNFSSTEANPKFTFDTAGNYAIKLVVTNTAGTDEITKTVTVTQAVAAPVADFSFAPTNPETGQEVSFTNESQNATSYQWSAAGTNFSSTEANPKFTFDTAGDFDVKLVVTNTAGSHEITKTVTVTAASNGGGNSNPCNLPECYVEKTTTVSSGFTTTVIYGYTVVNGQKLIASITTGTPAGNIVTSFQYDSQARKIKDEVKLGGTLQSTIEYEYSNGDKTVKANSFDASGNLTGYTISEYDTNNRLTRTENYSSNDALTGYTVYSNFVNIEGSFPQLVETFDANGTITQTDTHTYENCQLKSSVSKNGSGTVIGEINNTIDANKLLRTSVSTIITQGFSITSTTQYTYDCD